MICWFNNHSNSVQYNPNLVFFTSSISSANNGTYLENGNFRNGIALYVSRNRDVLKQKWVSNTDVYLSPKNKIIPGETTYD
jgi:hypothetical protein